MTTLTLSEDEVRELTQRVRHSAQIRALRAMGVEHRVRPDGTAAVLRSHLESLMGSALKPSWRKEWEPNWSAA